jgi:S1-C subfamily serine protease
VRRSAGVVTIVTTIASVAAGFLLVSLATTRARATSEAALDQAALDSTGATVTPVAATAATDTSAATAARLTDVSDVVAAVIVANAHVVDAGGTISVTLADDTAYPATRLGADQLHDIAVLDIDASDLTPIELGTSEALLVGDPVIAVGYPLGLDGAPTVSTGIVSALGRTLEDTEVSLDGVIQTDAAMTEGSSGGALLDSGGKLVGITAAVGVSSVGIEGIGFAIPVETVTGVVTALTAT